MTKDARLAVRLAEHQLERIREAAGVSGQTVSDFAVRTLTHEAANVLADRRAFVLDGPSWTEFMALIDRPVQHKPRLEKLLSGPSPFANA